MGHCFDSVEPYPTPTLLPVESRNTDVKHKADDHEVYHHEENTRAETTKTEEQRWVQKHVPAWSHSPSPSPRNPTGETLKKLSLMESNRHESSLFGKASVASLLTASTVTSLMEEDKDQQSGSSYLSYVSLHDAPPTHHTPQASVEPKEKTEKKDWRRRKADECFSFRSAVVQRLVEENEACYMTLWAAEVAARKSRRGSSGSGEETPWHASTLRASMGTTMAMPERKMTMASSRAEQSVSTWNTHQKKPNGPSSASSSSGASSVEELSSPPASLRSFSVFSSCSPSRIRHGPSSFPPPSWPFSSPSSTWAEGSAAAPSPSTPTSSSDRVKYFQMGRREPNVGRGHAAEDEAHVGPSLNTTGEVPSVRKQGNEAGTRKDDDGGMPTGENHLPENKHDEEDEDKWSRLWTLKEEEHHRRNTRCSTTPVRPLSFSLSCEKNTPSNLTPSPTVVRATLSPPVSPTSVDVEHTTPETSWEAMTSCVWWNHLLSTAEALKDLQRESVLLTTHMHHTTTLSLLRLADQRYQWRRTLEALRPRLMECGNTLRDVGASLRSWISNTMDVKERNTAMTHDFRDVSMQGKWSEEERSNDTDEVDDEDDEESLDQLAFALEQWDSKVHSLLFTLEQTRGKRPSQTVVAISKGKEDWPDTRGPPSRWENRYTSTTLLSAPEEGHHHGHEKKKMKDSQGNGGTKRRAKEKELIMPSPFSSAFFSSHAVLPSVSIPFVLAAYLSSLLTSWQAMRLSLEALYQLLL